MARLEETFVALGCCVGEFPGEEYCKNCVYQPYRFGTCKDDAIRDARKKLLERKDIKKKPIKFMDGLVERYKCECGQHLLHANYGNWDYCPKCGQAIGWEDGEQE